MSAALKLVFTASGKRALDLSQIENKSNWHFERFMLYQELVRLAIESLPNDTDSDVPKALLHGLQAMLGEDCSCMHHVSESVSVLVEATRGGGA